MLRNRGNCATERVIKHDVLRAFEREYFARPRYLYEASCQANINRQPRYCTSQKPVYYTGRSSVTSYRRPVKRVYLPDESSLESMVYCRKPRYNTGCYYPNEAFERSFKRDQMYPEGYYSRRPSSMYENDNENEKFHAVSPTSYSTKKHLVRKVTRKLSPIFPCDCAKSKVKQQKTNRSKVCREHLSQEAKDLSRDIYKILSLIRKADGAEDRVSSISELENIQDLDCSSHKNVAKLITQRVQICHKIGRGKQDNPSEKFKAATSVESKIDALVIALKQYEAENMLNEESSHVDYETKYNYFVSDPPSLGIQSFFRGVKKSSTNNEVENAKNIDLQTVYPETSDKSVCGDIKTNEDNLIVERKSIRSRLSWRKKEIKEGNGEHFGSIVESEQSIFENNSANRPLTMNKLGLMIKIGGKMQRPKTPKEKQQSSKEKDKMSNAKPWIQKFLEGQYANNGALRVRWNNKAFHTRSSSTIIEIINNVYKQIGKTNKKQTEIRESSKSDDISANRKKHRKTAHKSNTRFPKSSKRPKYRQRLEAYMMPQTIVPGPVYMPERSNRNEKDNVLNKKLSALCDMTNKTKAYLEKHILKNKFKNPCCPPSSKFEIKLPDGIFESDSAADADNPASGTHVHKNLKHETIICDSIDKTPDLQSNRKKMNQTTDNQSNVFDSKNRNEISKITCCLMESVDNKIKVTGTEPELEPSVSLFKIEESHEHVVLSLPRRKCSLVDKIFEDEILSLIPSSDESLIRFEYYEDYCDKITSIHDESARSISNINLGTDSVKNTNNCDSKQDNILDLVVSKGTTDYKREECRVSSHNRLNKRANGAFSESLIGIDSRKPFRQSVWKLIKGLLRKDSSPKHKPPPTLSLLTPPKSVSEPEFSCTLPELECICKLPEPKDTHQIPESDCSSRLPEPECSSHLPEPEDSYNLPEFGSCKLPEPKDSDEQPEPESSYKLLEPEFSCNQPESKDSYKLSELECLCKLPDSEFSLKLPKPEDSYELPEPKDSYKLLESGSFKLPEPEFSCKLTDPNEFDKPLRNLDQVQLQVSEKTQLALERPRLVQSAYAVLQKDKKFESDKYISVPMRFVRSADAIATNLTIAHSNKSLYMVKPSTSIRSLSSVHISLQSEEHVLEKIRTARILSEFPGLTELPYEIKEEPDTPKAIITRIRLVRSGHDVQPEKLIKFVTFRSMPVLQQVCQLRIQQLILQFGSINANPIEQELKLQSIIKLPLEPEVPDPHHCKKVSSKCKLQDNETAIEDTNIGQVESGNNQMPVALHSSDGTDPNEIEIVKADTDIGQDETGNSQIHVVLHSSDGTEPNKIDLVKADTNIGQDETVNSQIHVALHSSDGTEPNKIDLVKTDTNIGQDETVNSQIHVALHISDGTEPNKIDSVKADTNFEQDETVNNQMPIALRSSDGTEPNKIDSVKADTNIRQDETVNNQMPIVLHSSDAENPNKMDSDKTDSTQELTVIKQLQNCLECDINVSRKSKSNIRNKKYINMTYLTQMSRVVNNVNSAQNPCLDANKVQFSLKITEGNKVTRISIRNPNSKKVSNRKSVKGAHAQELLFHERTAPTNESNQPVPSENVKVYIKLKKKGNKGVNNCEIIDNHVLDQSPEEELNDAAVAVKNFCDRKNSIIDDLTFTEQPLANKYPDSLPVTKSYPQINAISGYNRESFYVMKSASHSSISEAKLKDVITVDEYSCVENYLNNIATESYVDKVLNITDRFDYKNREHLDEIERILNANAFREMAFIDTLKSQNEETFSSLRRQLLERKKIVNILSDINTKNRKHKMEDTSANDDECFADIDTDDYSNDGIVLARKLNSHRRVEDVPTKVNFKAKDDVADNHNIIQLVDPVEETFHKTIEEVLFPDDILDIQHDNYDNVQSNDDIKVASTSKAIKCESSSKREKKKPKEDRPVIHYRLKQERTKNRNVKGSLSDTRVNDVGLIDVDSCQSLNSSFTEYKVVFKKDNQFTEAGHKLDYAFDQFDVLQSYKIKKAVLELYTEKVEDGGCLIAKIPKCLRL